ncbi:hypothetical protein O181_108539 [Austropuccinia psidii MF-1]|uniref:Uncharacterized protein n=1 Tax=Austropuccinia psidii MF-1 TaxID=1389203 RepID=A0A9Q3JW95_9BASI|nr:hypothetical protein [Austropuccinia psidii MF-1]
MAAIRRLFKDPNHLALQELGWQFNSGLFKRAISQEYYVISISCQGSKHFSITWTIQFVHTGNTQVSCMTLAQLGQFSPTVQFSRWQELYWPNSDNTAGDSPSRIILSALHIYWPPFGTWGLFSS